MREDIKTIVDKLIKKYKTNNIYELIKSLDISIFELPFDEEIGMYKFIKNNKVIIISEGLQEETKRFILAHELGHAVLHRKENCFYLKHNTLAKTSIYEIEANKFASELLINDNELKECAGHNFTAEQLACYFKVPVELIEYKFKMSM